MSIKRIELETLRDRIAAQASDAAHSALLSRDPNSFTPIPVGPDGKPRPGAAFGAYGMVLESLDRRIAHERTSARVKAAMREAEHAKPLDVAAERDAQREQALELIRKAIRGEPMPGREHTRFGILAGGPGERIQYDFKRWRTALHESAHGVAVIVNGGLVDRLIIHAGGRGRLGTCHHRGVKGQLESATISLAGPMAVQRFAGRGEWLTIDDAGGSGDRTGALAALRVHYGGHVEANDNEFWAACAAAHELCKLYDREIYATACILYDAGTIDGADALACFLAWREREALGLPAEPVATDYEKRWEFARA